MLNLNNLTNAISSTEICKNLLVSEYLIQLQNKKDELTFLLNDLLIELNYLTVESNSDRILRILDKINEL